MRHKVHSPTFELGIDLHQEMQKNLVVHAEHIAADKSGVVSFYVAIRVAANLALRMEFAADTESAKAILIHAVVNTATKLLEPEASLWVLASELMHCHVYGMTNDLLLGFTPVVPVCGLRCVDQFQQGRIDVVRTPANGHYVLDLSLGSRMWSLAQAANHCQPIQTGT